MNFIKRAGIRLSQAMLHLIKPILPYREPIKLGGASDIPAALLSGGRHKPLIVTDKGVLGAGVTEPLLAALRDADIEYSLYTGTLANPTVDNVNEGKRVYIDNACDSLIAIGGGSSIDCAKAVGALIAKPGKKIGELEGTMRVGRRIPLLIAIPTTAGTGSEASPASVITDTERRHKYLVNDFNLVPKYILLDPMFTRSLPPCLTASTGMDALTHAIEVYIGTSMTRASRECATEAVKLIFANLPRAYRDGEDMEARGNMLRASYLAGVAISHSYVGYVHAISHSLSGRYGLAHGHTNAVILPYMLEAFGDSVYKSLGELAKIIGIREDREDDKGA